MSLFQKDVLRIADITPEEIEEILTTAKEMRKYGGTKILSGKIMTALFYESSSRTFGSFLSAMQRLGGGTIPLQGVEYSSVVKGETFEDTVKTFSHLSDIVVIRHPLEGSAQIAAQACDVPVINAGDGVGEHPTQALLDLFTIFDHFDDISTLKITFVGDLLYGRTVHSLAQLVSRYGPKEIRFVSPSELQMPKKFANLITYQTDNLVEVLEDTDVLYMTRVQKERFSDPLAYARLKNSFRVTAATMKKLKKTAILMHPFPRVNEIDTEVDSDARALYLREQISNGMYIRMALLSLILNK